MKYPTNQPALRLNAQLEKYKAENEMQDCGYQVIIFVCAGFALWAHHASANAFRVPDKPIEIGSHHTLSPIAAYRFEKKEQVHRR